MMGALYSLFAQDMKNHRIGPGNMCPRVSTFNITKVNIYALFMIHVLFIMNAVIFIMNIIHILFILNAVLFILNNVTFMMNNIQIYDSCHSR